VKVLVAGGAGYIGSVVTAALVQAGHEAVVLDDLSTGHRDAVPDGVSFVASPQHSHHYACVGASPSRRRSLRYLVPIDPLHPTSGL